MPFLSQIEYPKSRKTAWVWEKIERETGLEPATLTMAR